MSRVAKVRPTSRVRPARSPAATVRVASILAAFLAVLASSAAAQDEIAFPRLSGRVVDEADLLSRAQRNQLEERLAGHEAASSNQVVVVTLASLRGRTIEEFGYRLGRHWGIGQKDQDNGVLLIVAPNEREVRIEVGYGLEGTLTDAISSNIVNGVILPAFRRGDLAGGIVAGATSVIEALGGEYEMRRSTTRTAERRFPSLLVPLLFIVLFVFLNFVPHGGRRRRGLYGYPVIGGRSGGFGGGGFGGGLGGGFGGGGGGFGGGGASGGW